MTIFERDQYSVECTGESGIAVMRGVMRLSSPAAYDAAFAVLRARMDGGQPLTVDLTSVSFMNSSGIRALASLVLLAKANRASLRMIASQKVPWQRKTVASFRAINPDLTVELR